MRVRPRFVLGALALLLAAVGYAPNSRAGVYVFTYSDGKGDAANGQLTTSPSGLGDGSEFVTSGIMTVTASSDGNASIGTYSIQAHGPAQTSTANFIVDNLVYPANNAGSGKLNPDSPNVTNPSFLTNYGLDFGPPGTGLNSEVNIWGNGNGDYAFVGADNVLGATEGGHFTLTPAPEPSSLILLGAIAGFGLRYRRRRD